MYSTFIIIITVDKIKIVVFIFHRKRPAVLTHSTGRGGAAMVFSGVHPRWKHEPPTPLTSFICSWYPKQEQIVKTGCMRKYENLLYWEDFWHTAVLGSRKHNCKVCSSIFENMTSCKQNDKMNNIGSREQFMGKEKSKTALIFHPFPPISECIFGRCLPPWGRFI